MTVINTVKGHVGFFVGIDIASLMGGIKGWHDAMLTIRIHIDIFHCHRLISSIRID
jgi:hypothetical protein